jgi:hypothetical protein
MSAIADLRSYAKQLQDRFRLGVVARGGALVATVALVATLVLTVIISRFAFTAASLWSARVVLLLALGFFATFGLAIPLWHWSQRWWTRRAEQIFPQFEQRLVTFNERDRHSGDPFLELLAADTLRVARTADVKEAVSDRVLQSSLVVGVLSLGVLVWLVSAGPGYLGYGAAAIWRGPPAEPFYSLHVDPGNATVRRHADQLVTAEIPGLPSRHLRIHVRYQSAAKWEETPMQQRPATPGFQFLFAGIPEDVEYYVESGSIQTPHFRLRVADIPTVKQIRVTYHHPEWMKLGDTVEEHGGDLRAVEGTEAQLEVVTDRPLTNGLLALDDGRQIALTTAGSGNVYRASLAIEKDGSYHVATRETVQEQRLSEDYFIQATAVKPPEVAMVRPERDYRASPIEEVTLAATADDPFGLNEFTLHYSVNGGPDQTVDLMKPPESGTAKKLSGSAMLSLETLKLLPGDVIGFYATAKDARSEAHTDISFIQVEPYEREFSQSQQAGGGGGGGGAADDQAQIAEREKEIISATWKQAGMKTASSKQAAEQAKFLSDVQTTLRNQATALAGRLEMRDLQLANEQFGSFQQDMQAAAAAMQPAAKKLDGQQWHAAVFDEQKALQYLLRAEATFRQIQVAYGSRGGGSGAVNSAGRDLASLFDLELDTQKNQYESAQTASPQNQQAADVESALKKLDELARRQSELAQQHTNDTQQSAEERWQQEMLRRQAEELQRQLEQLARNNGQSSQSSSASSSSSSGQSQSSSSKGQRSGGGSSSNGAAGNSTADTGARASAQQALDRLRQAEQDMQRAVDEHNVGDARSAAERLREAMNLLGGIQKQDSSRQVDALAREASRLQNQQKEQADRMRALINSRMSAQGGAGGPRPTRDSVEGLINDRQRLADDLARLTRDMRAAEHGAQERSRGASKRLHDAVGDLEQADTETQMQRSADQLRRGYAPLTDDVENQIASELGHLRDQLGDAQQAFAANARANGNGAGDNNGDATARGQRPADADQAAAEAMERLRSRLAALDPNMRGLGNEARNGPGGGQPGQPGANGQSANGGADGQLGRSANAGGDGQSGAGQFAGGVYGGGRGNRGGAVNGGWNTGNNTELPHAVAPDRSAPPPDTEQVIRQGLQDLDQLRRSVGEDPAARHEIDELVRSMKDLDPKRFPGNPAMVNELYARVLGDVDKLELQLHHDPGALPPTQVRSDSPQPIPSGYQSAVADYFRRLSQSP